MALPPMGQVASAIYQQLRLLAPTDEQLGWPLAHFIAAKAGPLEDIAAWVSDTDDGPGYSIFLDIDRCPAIALPWLAQFKGVVIPDGLTEAEQRAWVHTAEGQHRGTVDALVAAGQRHLTGTKTVRVLERVGGNAYAITVITRTSEMPLTDLPTVNLVTNPSFEVNTTGWGTTASFRMTAGATLTRVTTPAPWVGVGALRVVTTAGSANQGADCTGLVVTAGKKYRVSAYVRGNAGGEAVRLFAGDATVGATSTAIVASTGWQRISFLWQPTTSGTTGVATRLDGTAVATFFVDGVMVVEVSDAVSDPAYFDGDTPGYAWTGTAHASTSQRVVTTIVHDDLVAAKRIGILLTYVVSDAPIIDEWTRTITAVTATIDALTIADVT